VSRQFTARLGAPEDGREQTARALRGRAQPSPSWCASPSQAVPQLVLELLPRVVQAAHDGAFGTLHDTADVVVRKTFDFAQKYDGFVIGGQFVDCLPHALSDLV